MFTLHKKVASMMLRGILLSLMIGSPGLQAQNHDPEPYVFDATDPVVETEGENVGQDRFILGWNWGDRPPAALSEALNMNMRHGDNLNVYFGLSDVDENNDGIPDHGTDVTEDMELVVALRDHCTVTVTDYPVVGYDPETDEGFVRYDHNILLTGLATEYWHASLIHGPAMQYSPINTIDSEGNLAVYNDGVKDASSLACFGFQTKAHEGIVEEYNGKHQWVLRADLFDGTATVLEDPWPNDVLFRRDEIGGAGMADGIMNGSEWYVSINLRLMEVSNLDDEAVVLTIELPYTTPDMLDAGEVEYVVFDSIPTTTIEALADNRGDVTTLKLAPGNKRIVEVRRGMLPDYVADDIENDVTISAHFRMRGVTNARLPVVEQVPNIEQDYINNDVNNPHPSNQQLATLGIEVNYMDNADLAITWVKFETPWARWLARGKFDTKIKDVIDDGVDLVKNLASPAGVTISRFYGTDEAPIAMWQAQRYLNIITGGRASTEMKIVHRDGEPNSISRRNMANYWRQLMGRREVWFGGTPLGAGHAAPFVLGGTYGVNHNSAFMNYKYPYIQRNYGSLDPAATDNRWQHNFLSHYETSVFLNRPGDWALPPLDDEEGSGSQPNRSAYQDMLSERGLEYIQAYWDQRLHFEYHENTEMLFDVNPWWVNLWTYVHFGSPNRPAGDILRDIKDHRPKTGEETRLQLWTNVLLGAKGLVYYRGTSSNLLEFNLVGISNEEDPINWPNGLNGRDLIEDDDLLGGDFITITMNQTATDHTQLAEVIKNPDGSIDEQQTNIERVNNILLNGRGNLGSNNDLETAPIVDLGNNEFYIGRRSMRLEIYNIHDWIAGPSGFDGDQTVGELLMDLDLYDWYGRGFRSEPTRTTNPKVNSPVLDQLVNLDDISISNINTFIDNNPAAPEESISEDRFFDVMLLDGPDLSDEVYYVGVVNRLTNPVIVTDQDLSTVLDPAPMVLYQPGNPSQSAVLPGVDLDEDGQADVGQGGVELDETVYFVTESQLKELIDAEVPGINAYSQLGSRRMRLPFNYTHDGDGYALLHIREVGENNDALEGEGLEMVIRTDEFIEFNLKPGQGRFFRIKVLAPDETNNSEGDLAYANQRKLAVRRDLNGNSSSQQYLAVFHRTTDQTGGALSTDRVFYQTSTSTALAEDFEDTEFANIEWEPTVTDISQVIEREVSGTAIALVLGCSHPSIVYDPEQDMVHAVYACLYLENNVQRIGIIENSFPPDNPDVTGRELASFDVTALPGGYDNPLDVWGTPVISLTDGLLFIAWSSAKGGIGVGVKTPGGNALLNLPQTISVNNNETARHPSLISYSRIEGGEDETALVWQESAGGPAAGSEIFYTRLEFNNSQIDHFLAKGTLRPALSSTDLFLEDGDQIMVLSRLTEDPANPGACAALNYVAPVIQRDQAQPLRATQLRPIQVPLGGYAPVEGNFISDCISWACDGEEGSTSRIFFRMPTFFDFVDNGVPTTEIFLPNVGQVIELTDHALSRPDLTNGESRPLFYPFNNVPEVIGPSTGAGPFSFILNYRAENQGAFPAPAQGRHLPLRRRSLLTDLSDESDMDRLTEMLRNSSIIHGTDDIGYIQLSATPESVFDADTYRRTRRIYNLPESDPDGPIFASAQHFYLQQGDAHEVLLAPGCREFCSTYIFFLPGKNGIGGEYKRLKLSGAVPSPLASAQYGSFEPMLEEVSSDWFDVNNGDVLSFYGRGDDSGCLSAVLERQDGGSEIDIPLPNTPNDEAVRVEYTIQNPAATQYRLKLSFIENSPISTYSESFVAGQFDVGSGTVVGNLKTAQEPHTGALDLGFHSVEQNGTALALHPHPASDFFNMLARNTSMTGEGVSFTVRDVRGAVLTRVNGTYGVTLRLDTSQWPAGMYTVEAAASNPGAYAAAPTRSTLILVP